MYTFAFYKVACSMCFVTRNHILLHIGFKYSERPGAWPIISVAISANARYFLESMLIKLA